MIRNLIQARKDTRHMRTTQQRNQNWKNIAEPAPSESKRIARYSCVWLAGFNVDQSRLSRKLINFAIYTFVLAACIHIFLVIYFLMLRTEE